MNKLASIDISSCEFEQGTFEYRGDDEAARLMYDGGWKDKAAEGYGVMKWQNGDRSLGHWVSGQWSGGIKGVTLISIIWIALKSRVVIIITSISITVISVLTTASLHILIRYEGDWVAGLREGKGKYLSKATGERVLLTTRMMGGHRGQIWGRVCGRPEGGFGQIHFCQRWLLWRPVEGWTQTWTRDLHLEGEEWKVGSSHNFLLLSVLSISIIAFFRSYQQKHNLRLYPFSLSREMPLKHFFLILKQTAMNQVRHWWQFPWYISHDDLLLYLYIQTYMSFTLYIQR